MIEEPARVYLPKRAPDPRPARRPLLAFAILGSVAIHLGVAGAFWVEQPPVTEAGITLDIEVVAAAGQATEERRAAPAQAARAGAAAAAEALTRPEPVPVPRAAAAPAAPRGAPRPAAVPQPPAEAALAPAPAAAEAPTAIALRRARSASAIAVAAPRLRTAHGRSAAPPAEAAPPSAARRDHGRTPIIAADAPDAAPGAGPGGASPPRYGLGSAANPLPHYPEHARRQGWEGLVVLSVAVASDGRVESISIARSSGHPLLDAAARAAVQRWRFDPGRRAGMPVPATAQVPIRFRLD